MTRTGRRHHHRQTKHQLRICMDFSTTTSSNSSSSGSGSGSEQDLPEPLFPFSPSLSTLAALLEDIGDPQRLLYETVATPELEQVAVTLSKAIQLDGVPNKSALSPAAKHDPGHEMMQSSASSAMKRAPTIVLTSGEDAGDTSSNSAKRRPRTIFKLSHDASEKREVIVNASRARQKEKMMRLREKATTLERELLRLGKKIKTPGSMTPSTRATATTTSSGRVVVPRRPIWQRLANSAKDAKHRSEVENLQLRQTLEKQAKLSKSIGKLLTKCESLARQGSSPFQVVLSAVLQPGADDGDQGQRVFQELSAQLDFQYQRLDIVMNETGLAQRTIKGSQSKIRDLNCPFNSSGNTSDDAGVMIECCDVKHYPFAPAAVGEVGWRCLTSQATKNSNIFTRVVQQTENVAWTTTSVTIERFNASDVVMSIKSVLKRQIEQNRRVLLLNSVANLKPVGCEDDATTDSGLQIFDQGWGTIESMSDDSRYPASILRMCMRVRPEVQPQSAALAMMSLQDTDSQGTPTMTLPVLLVDMCTQTLRARHQVVENFLMEDLIAQRC